MPSIVDEVKMRLHVACGRVRLGACHLSPFDSTRARALQTRSQPKEPHGPCVQCLSRDTSKKETNHVVHVPASIEASLGLFIIMKSASSLGSV
jgi:hypothetical protein